MATVGIALMLISGPAAAQPHNADNVPSADKKASSKPATALERRAIELQQRAQETQAAYVQSVAWVEELTRHLAGLQARAAQSAATADAIYQDTTNAGSSDGLVSALSEWLTGSESDLERAAEAGDAAQHMQELVDLGRTGLEVAKIDAQHARREANAAKTAAAQMTVAASARAAATIATRQSQFRPSYRAATPDQDRRNRQALKGWERYLAALGDAYVVPPPADTLAKPTTLPGELRPVTDDKGSSVPGIGQVRGADMKPLTVLSAPAVRAVSEAFSRVGMSVEDQLIGADFYDCGGLVQQSWSAANLNVPADDLAQWQGQTAVPRRQLSIGDTIYFEKSRNGYGTGIYVGNKMMIAFDAATNEIAVREIKNSAVIGARRPTLPAEDRDAPPATPAVLTAGCHPTSPPIPDASIAPDGTWNIPLAPGSYSLSAGFGDGGQLWSSGEHTGQDFAAPIGTSVFASRAGIVTTEDSSWAGTLVRIDHGDGSESWYAHMSRIDVQTGQHVTAGELIGGVGSEGNSTGPHLHFELHIDGQAIDPMSLL